MLGSDSSDNVPYIKQVGSHSHERKEFLGHRGKRRKVLGKSQEGNEEK